MATRSWKVPGPPGLLRFEFRLDWDRIEETLRSRESSPPAGEAVSPGEAQSPAPTPKEK